MNIAIVYGTYSSSTQTATKFLEDVLTEHGHTVTRKQAHEAAAHDITNSDLVIIASPSWLIDGKDGQPHEEVSSFLQQLPDTAFHNQKVAVLGLGDTSYAHFCGAVDVIEGILKTHQASLLPSQRIDGYYMNQDVNNQAITAWADALLS